MLRLCQIELNLNLDVCKIFLTVTEGLEDSELKHFKIKIVYGVTSYNDGRLTVNMNF